MKVKIIIRWYRSCLSDDISFMAHPAKAYVAAGKMLKAMLNVCLGQNIRNYCLSPASKTPLEPLSLGEERSHFFIPASCSNEKGSTAPPGTYLLPELCLFAGYQIIERLCNEHAPFLRYVLGRQAGSLLFIETGPVDMDIRFLPPALLSASPACPVK